MVNRTFPDFMLGDVAKRVFSPRSFDFVIACVKSHFPVFTDAITAGSDILEISSAYPLALQNLTAKSIAWPTILLSLT